MIELIDLNLVNSEEYRKINMELQEICKYGPIQHMCYFLEYPWIISNLPKGIKSIADIGGGIEACQFYLGKRYDTTNVDRMPYQKLLNTFSSNSKINIKYFQTELGDLSLNYKVSDSDLVDCIVSCSAVEHNLPLYTENCFINMKKMLKKDGLIIITVPFTKEIETHENMITFTKERVEQLAKKVGLTLLNDKSNFDKYDEYLVEYKKANVDSVSGGFILKNG